MWPPEPPEPTDEEIEEMHTEQSAATSSQIRIEGLTANDIHSTIMGILRSNYQLQETIDRKIDEAIEEKVSSITDGVIRERVTAVIDAALAEGVAEFDRYTGKETKRTQIAELVHAELTRRYSEGFGSSGTRSASEHAVERAVKKLFDEELKNELAAVKADFKKQADEVFKAKLVAGMREALGMR